MDIAKLRDYLANCDPKVPLQELDDPRYVHLDEGHAVRGSDGSLIEELQRSILLELPQGSSCRVFSGFPGSGKTTELNRLQRKLIQDSEDPSTVVFFDAEVEYLDRYQPLSITDILRVLAYHLDRAATIAEGGDPTASPGYLKRLWDWLSGDVRLKSLDFDMFGVGLMAEIGANPSFREKLNEAISLRFQHFASEAHEVIAEAVRRLRKATGRDRVVVIVDGMEKLWTPLTPDAVLEMEQSAETVFAKHAEWLRLPCHCVYTFPVWLRYRTTELGLHYGSPLTLPMIKVRHQDGRADPAGIARMAEIVVKRFDAIEAVFGADHEPKLRALVEASGGYPRDLLRLVYNTLKKARTFPIGMDVIERVIAVLEQEYHFNLLRADLGVLDHIAREHQLPTGEAALRAVSWLFDRWLVLTYRNGREWYDVHPLVQRSELLKKRADG